LTWRFPGGVGKRWAEGVDRQADTLGTLTTVFSVSRSGFKRRARADGVSLHPHRHHAGRCADSGPVRYFWLERTPADDMPETTRAGSRWQKAALPDDVNLWQHQRYVEHPAAQRDEARAARAAALEARFYPHADDIRFRRSHNEYDRTHCPGVWTRATSTPLTIA